MDVKPFIESGIIEEYCLGLLSASKNEEIEQLASRFTEIESEIQAIESSLASYAKVPLKSKLKATIFRTLSELAKQESIDLENPPKINRHSDYNLWNASLEFIEPDNSNGTTKTKIFFKNKDYQLCVAWLRDELAEDAHHDEKYHESFLILEGNCQCNLNGRIIDLEAGDFLDIPAETHHTIKNTSKELGYVKALIQRVRKVA